MTEPIEELAEDFSLFGTWEERYGYVIELGQELPPLDPALKTEASRVQGCVSQVWLAARPSDERPGGVELLADSDAHIVRGLVAILLRLYSHRTPEEIAAVSALEVFERLGLSRHLSPNRRNGLEAMVQRIHELAERARQAADPRAPGSRAPRET